MPTILCDLDGVLADFNQAAFDVHGRPFETPTEWNYYRKWPIADEEFWKRIHDCGSAFYKNYVKPLPDFEKILDLIRGSGVDWKIVSDSSDHPDGYSGKLIWCQRFLSSVPDVMIVRDKWLLADYDRFLIDDGEHNTSKFRSAEYGNKGPAFLWPSPWNPAWMGYETRFEDLKKALGVWLDGL